MLNSHEFTWLDLNNMKANIAGFARGCNAVTPLGRITFAVAGFRLLPVVNRIQGQVLISLIQLLLAEITITKKGCPGQNLCPRLSSRNNFANDSSLILLNNVPYTYPASSEPKPSKTIQKFLSEKVALLLALLYLKKLLLWT